jgi:predicted  nucleic acid-binding Zn-ribbon protein
MLMAREHLRTDEDVNTFISDSKHKMEYLSEARNKVRNKLRRASEPEQIEQLKAERDALTADIGKLRKEIRTAEFTLERSQQVQNDIEIELSACGMTRSRNHRDRDGR